MTKVQYTNPKTTFKSYLAVGYFDLPDTKNFKLNKYGFPSYIQTNADIQYQFQGAKGLTHIYYTCTNLMLVKPMATKFYFQ
jgi:hypothetical protein